MSLAWTRPRLCIFFITWFINFFSFFSPFFLVVKHFSLIFHLHNVSALLAGQTVNSILVARLFVSLARFCRTGTRTRAQACYCQCCFRAKRFSRVLHDPPCFGNKSRNMSKKSFKFQQAVAHDFHVNSGLTFFWHKPCTIKFLEKRLKAHNLWFCVCLLLQNVWLWNGFRERPRSKGI